MRPVLGREVEERKQGIPVVSQLLVALGQLASKRFMQRMKATASWITADPYLQPEPTFPGIWPGMI